MIVTHIDWQKIALFASGIFFGGALDHLILAVMRNPSSPYTVRVGVIGNWLLGALDALIAGSLYALHRWLERRARK